MEANHKSVAAFFDEHGRLTQLPVKRNTRRLVLETVAERFEPDRRYTEKEINAICDTWHTFGDYFALRRCLVDEGFLGRERDGSQYWREKHTQQEGASQ